MNIVSGMRPTGKLHLGHLLGALDKWLDLQNSAEHRCFFFIADLHALTTQQTADRHIGTNSREMLLDWLAAGIDPEKTLIFQQSLVPQHSELFTFFSMVTPVGWLERNPSYKELKRELGEGQTSQLGFLAYPVMQAADIALYKGEGVPVGDDQVPHLELAREIVRRFNHEFGLHLAEPQALLTPASRIRGIDGRKMSKSFDNAIYLSDPAAVIEKKIRSMQTDKKRVRRQDPGEPKDCDFFPLHEALSPSQIISEVEVGCRSAAIGCVDCKKLLLPNLAQRLEPIREKRAQLSAHPQRMTEILVEGSSQAKQIAETHMETIRSGVLPGVTKMERS